MRGSSGPDSALRASRSVVLGLAALCLLFAGVFPPFANPNELSRFQTVVSAVDRGTFTIDEAIQTLGDHEDKAISDGHAYSNKAPGLALAAIPVYAALRLAMPPPEAGTGDAIFRLLRLLTVSAVCLLGLARFARRLASGPNEAAAALVACAAAFGTGYLFFARSFFSHAWSAALLFLSWELLRDAASARTPRGEAARRVAAGLLAGWAVISEYNVLPVAALLGLRAAADRRFRSVVPFAAGAALALAALGAYDSVCFGSPWVLSSAREAYPAYSRLAERGFFGIGPPDPAVAAAYLLHPARGVLLFSPFLLWTLPGLLLWWRSGKQRADCALAAGATALYFVAMAGYPNWHGGWSLGSRYLLPVLFFASLPIAHALTTPLSRGLFAAAVAFSVAGHFLLTASWPYFPDDVQWPVATGSLWFLERGWIAPSVVSGAGGSAATITLLLAAGACAVPLVLALRAAGPMSPRPAVAAVLGLAPLVVLLLRPPHLAYGARLWRAAIYGAYSGEDPGREELRRVVSSAASPEERRQARGAWAVYGPR
jgi:hypothetical protein